MKANIDFLSRMFNQEKLERFDELEKELEKCFYGQKVIYTKLENCVSSQTF